MGEDGMRKVAVGLFAVIVLCGCATLQRTEQLPSPATDALPGGPEGDGGGMDGL
jgi:hypothetical protein